MILLVTEQRDLTADLVVGRLRDVGATFARLNVERALSDVTLESSPGSYKFRDEHGERHDLSSVKAILYRSHEAPASHPELRPSEAAFAKREALAHLFGCLFSVEALWINHPAANWTASQKVAQLERARRLGFRLPRTLVTRDPAAALRFVRDLSGPAIAKPVTFGSVGSGPEERAIYSTRLPSSLSEDDFADVALAPVILQEEVRKGRDLRVTVIGTQAIAVAIESQRRPETETDWRAPCEVPLEQHVIALPPAIVELCIRLTTQLGLVFGAIDLVEAKETGDIYFLEINPAGQWGWLQLEAGADVLSPLTELLIRGHV